MHRPARSREAQTLRFNFEKKETFVKRNDMAWGGSATDDIMHDLSPYRSCESVINVLHFFTSACATRTQSRMSLFL